MSTELIQVMQESPLAEEKKDVVKSLLAPFFAKAEEWKSQVDSIEITDPSQTDKMALAKTGRLQLRRYRLDAEKLIKEQREIVKARMADDVLEDKMLLRSGQMVVAVFDNLETKLEHKEKFAERWEAEQREIRRKERLAIIAEFGVIEVPGLADFPQDAFDAYVTGLRAKRDAEIKAEQERIEAARKENLHNDRKSRLAKYEDFIPEFNSLNFGEMDEAEYIKIGTQAKAKKDEYDAEQAKIKAENERFQKEAIKAQERANQIKVLSADRFRKLQSLGFTYPFDDLGEMPEPHFNQMAQEHLKEFTAKELKAEKLRKENEAIQAKLKAEADAKLKAEQEKARKAQEDAEKLRKAEQSRIDAENARIKAEQEKQEALQAQSESVRLESWINSFELPQPPQGKYTKKTQATISVIQAKFEAFKKWAQTENK